MIARCLQIAPFKSFHIVWLGEKKMCLWFLRPCRQLSYSLGLRLLLFGLRTAAFKFDCSPQPKRGGGEIQGCLRVSNAREKDFS